MRANGRPGSVHDVQRYHFAQGPAWSVLPGTLTRLVAGTTRPKLDTLKTMDGRGSDKSPPDDDLHGRKLVERVLRDTIKRVVESGVGKISEGPRTLRNLVSDLKLPKEIANYLFSQIDETKNGLYRVVAKEIRGFLQQNNLGEEMAKALAHLSVEIKTEIRLSRRPPRGGRWLGRQGVRSGGPRSKRRCRSNPKARPQDTPLRRSFAPASYEAVTKKIGTGRSGELAWPSKKHEIRHIRAHGWDLFAMGQRDEGGFSDLVERKLHQKC